ncbi:MAG: cupin domain-containing protein [Boseongicola sp.]|nr:cupin domain-containing protein [Boseongicola sp.]
MSVPASSDGTASGTVLVENERTRVTEWRFPVKGDNTGWHVHEHDYLVVPLTDGQLLLQEPDGSTRVVDLHCGAPYFRTKGVHHDVVNASDFEIAFIEVEFLESVTV